MLTVDVPQSVAERLNTASAKRRWYPFDDDVIDWSVPLSDEWAYMPAGRSIFTASDIGERLDPAGRSFVERWEMTQRMRNTAHGEHLLNQGILAMLWSVDPYDPSYRYLLHEVAEECQHMAMFNAWVRLNADIETAGAGEAMWGKTMADFTEDLACTQPEAFWVNVLLFEFVGDDFNQAMRAEGGQVKGNDGRPLHPILVQIGGTHASEEARHIMYARRWLQEGMPKLDDAAVAQVQRVAELGAQVLIGQKSEILPVAYSAQLEPYMTEVEFKAAQDASPVAANMLCQLKKLLDEFESLRVVTPEAMAGWSATGCFG